MTQADLLAKTVLLTIDMQNDFVLPAGTSPVPGTAAIAPAAARLVNAWRDAGLPIVHVVRFYERDGSDAELGRRDAIRGGPGVAEAGSWGAALVDGLLPAAAPPLDHDLLRAGRLQPFGPAEWAMYKPRWGAFYRTPLEAHLRSLEAEGVLVCGCNLPNCPRATLFEASERDFHAAVVSDATSGSTDGRLADLGLIHVDVITVAEVLSGLG